MIQFPFSFWKETAAGFNNCYTALDGVSKHYFVNDGTVYNFAKADPFSVTIWFKVNSIPSAGSNYTVFGKRDTGGSNSGYLLIVRDDGTLRYILQGESGGATNTSLVDTTAVIEVGEWYNVTVTYDGIPSGGNIKLYLNGLELASDTFADSIDFDNSSVDFKVGASRDLSTNNIDLPLDGDVDECAIFDYALSEYQVERISILSTAQDLNSILITGPIGWYRLGDEFTGSVDSPNQGSGSDPLTGNDITTSDIICNLPTVNYADNTKADTYITAASIDDDREIGVVHSFFKQYTTYRTNRSGVALSGITDQILLVSPTQESSALINAHNPGTNDAELVGTGHTFSQLGIEGNATSAVNTKLVMPKFPCFIYQQSKHSEPDTNRGVWGVVDGSDVSRQCFGILRQRSTGSGLDRFVVRYRSFGDTLAVNWNTNWNVTSPLGTTNPSTGNQNSHWANNSFIGNEFHNNTVSDDIMYIGGRNDVNGLSVGSEGPVDNGGDRVVGFIFLDNTNGDIDNNDIRLNINYMLEKYNKYVIDGGR